ncbi:MAG: hypothetical protein JO263_00690 [Candidatus Eremiobacteraeota bacterium]|nr:hypothetical protein [Candidatus Eremiobacteraeota bacterium]
MADSRNPALNACAWALERALHYAAATAVVALAIATVATGASAERFATAAYVAAIAAAVIAALRWFLPAPPAAPRAAGPPFPATFTFALGLALLVVASAAAASQSAAEVRVVALCFGIIGGAALVRGGALSAFRRRLADADYLDYLTVTIRYCVVVVICALAAAALFAGGVTDAFAKLAYASAFVATVLVTASLVAPSRVGALARTAYAESRRLLAAPAAAGVFARAAWYSVAMIVAGLLLTSVLPAGYGERFATVAYLASLVAAFAIGMRWLLRSADRDGAPPARAQWWRAAAIVAAWLIAGAGLAFSALGETALVVAALCAIAAAIKHAAPAH